MDKQRNDVLSVPVDGLENDNLEAASFRSDIGMDFHLIWRCSLGPVVSHSLVPVLGIIQSVISLVVLVVNPISCAIYDFAYNQSAWMNPPVKDNLNHQFSWNKVNITTELPDLLCDSERHREAELEVRIGFRN